MLDIPALDLAGGASLAVTGPSGCGKTSLLSVLSGLERPDCTRLTVCGTDLPPLSEAARDRWRRRTVGFIFQDFHLFPGMDALGNVLLPASFRAAGASAETRRAALSLLERVGLRDPHQPVESLSRGEMQRVAVARALLFRPPLVLADEPTASLDAAAAATVADLLLELVREAGSTLVLVTHDMALAGRLDSVLALAKPVPLGEIR
ncbi:ABC transporter ATP-binding protein [Azospirillum thermophilum]|uniref:ABC transporter ATP-binding protein n=1 Tax=Azospirillum thermophilum TaxID=2202148 RepID=UPI001FE3B039|nr:ATP-binding cassette domain-containing protein [Azospirillum thermophilum]